MESKATNEDHRTRPVCYATDKKGTSYASQNPNEAGALALANSHSSCKEVLVTVERYTDVGNPYVVPFGWFTREMLGVWRERNSMAATTEARGEA